MPKPEVDRIDHHIGLHTSQLIANDGTLQIGIGSLSDAVVHSLILRHRNTDIYKKCIGEISNVQSVELKNWDPFEHGVYGTSELLMDGFMHLRRSGILKRQIFDLDEKQICYLHAAFFLGSKELYDWLRHLEGEDRSGLRMTRVSKVNDLYDANEFALRKQRKNARFINTTMKVSLLGSA